LALIDCHTHSNCSDGCRAPESLINEAIFAQKKLAELATTDQKRREILSSKVIVGLTDHDTVSGIRPALVEIARLEEEKNIRPGQIVLLPGIEFSTYVQLGKVDFETHILGYFNPKHLERVELFIQRYRAARLKRVKAILVSLEKNSFYPPCKNHEKIPPVQITIEELVNECKSSHSIGRKHVAEAIVKKGRAKDISEAFKLFFYSGSPANVKKILPSPQEIYEFIHGKLDGKVIMAHPGLMGKIEVANHLIRKGWLDGLEIFYPYHFKKGLVELYLAIVHNADQHLIVTGGSDSHHDSEDTFDKRGPLGSVQIPNIYRQGICCMVAKILGLDKEIFFSKDAHDAPC